MGTDQDMARESEGDAFGTVDTLLCELDAGQFNTRASEAMRELLGKLHARAQEDSDASGKLSLEITFGVARSGKVEARASFKTNAPAPRCEASTFYVTNRGRLSARDPRQMKLPIRETKAARGGGRTVIETVNRGESRTEE
mgnify:CR=1 FL=1